MHKNWIARTLEALVLVCGAAAGSVGPAAVIHEWGTFTALQDEEGRAVAGINVDDEPVPGFVHDVAAGLVGARERVLRKYSKGTIPAAHPLITMRLETPVLYVHLPPGTESLRLDVDVAFRGGWLSQYFPNAVAEAPGLDPRGRGMLTSDTIGTLQWKDVRAHHEARPGPETTDPVWLAPRRVEAATLTVGDENERFLFYRGLGHVDAPLRIARDSEGDALLVRGAVPRDLLKNGPLSVGTLWLTDIRADGTTAWRSVQCADISAGAQAAGAVLAALPAVFRESDYGRREASATLRAELRRALVRDGLFEDEAESLLATWDASYFRAPGLRLFFLVPRAWTERILHLRLSVQCETVRTMVGRIDLVTPVQRRLIERITAGPTSDGKWYYEAGEARTRARASQPYDLGEILAERGTNVPADYRAYVDLGRFRDAILLDAQDRRPRYALGRFLETYRIRASEVLTAPLTAAGPR